MKGEPLDHVPLPRDIIQGGGGSKLKIIIVIRAATAGHGRTCTFYSVLVVDLPPFRLRYSDSKTVYRF